jgi:hypothetical protein
MPSTGFAFQCTVASEGLADPPWQPPQLRGALHARHTPPLPALATASLPVKHFPCWLACDAFLLLASLCGAIS